MPHSVAGHRAAQLAALPELGLTLPAEVRKPITTYKAVMGLRVPAIPPAAAMVTADLAIDRWYATAGKGSTTVSLDTTPIRDARQREQDAADQRALIIELQGAAVNGLCQAVDAQQGAVIRAIQARFRQVAGKLVEHARQIPASVHDDRTALEAGDTHWLAAHQEADKIEPLRSALADVEDAPARGPAPDALSVGLSYLSIPVIYDRLPVPYNGVSPWGRLSTVPFYVSLARDASIPADAWWLPTREEVTARCAELAADRRAERAHRAPAPAGPFG